MTLFTFARDSYLVGLLLMAATTVYLILRRSEFKAEHRRIVDFGVITAFVAFVAYSIYKDVVFSPTVPIYESLAMSLQLRNVAFLALAPLSMFYFGTIAVLAGANKHLVYRLVIATVVMAFSSYLANGAAVGTAGNYVNLALTALAWIYIIFQIAAAKLGKGSAEAKKTLATLRNYIYAWTFLPVIWATIMVIKLNSVGLASLAQAINAATVVLVILDILIVPVFLITGLKALKKN